MPATALVVGSGAREHAILSALSRSPSKPKLLCFGSANNPGIGSLCAATTVGKLTDANAIVAFANANGATVAVIGPEAPLEAGVADALRAANIPTVGPSKALAQIECSKGFALEVLGRHGVAGVPKFREFTSLEGAREYLEELGEGNYVVKADGLCGGKGVKVAGDHLASIDEAVAYCKECLPKFVLCEKLRGEEFSVLSFCDGTHLAHMPAVQDHKRAYEGDVGPNTGGMGSYTCADHLLPFITQEVLDEARAINAACVRALRTELGELYRGVLYGGYMITADKGVMLIEFNARLGDPECLNLLSLIDDTKTDFLRVCEAMASGGLKDVPVVFQRKASCCKYACPEGYPEKSLKGGEVDLSGLSNPKLCYLGAVDKDASGVLRGTGSRAVGVVALADELEEAEAMAESEVSAIKGRLFHRKDVGTANLVASRVKRMLSLQGELHTTAGPERKVRVGVLGSTRGSSLQPILRALSGGGLRNIEIAIVLSNKKDSGILARAERHGLPYAHVPCMKGTPRDVYDAEITSRLEAAGVEIVVLVGYMRILSAPFCARWQGKALNVHPSLLPAFAGGMDLEVHKAAVEAKVSESGCTVHLVEAEVDAGAIVVQKACPVYPTDTPESLKARVQPLEGPALCEAIAKIAATCRRDTPCAGDKRKAVDVSETHPYPLPIGEAAKKAKPLTYKSAGVDIDAGNALVDDIKPLAKATSRLGSMGSIGGFGGLFDMKASGYKDPILVSGTDGCGTKLMIAQASGMHEHIGIDLVAMVVNDLIVQGAEPLFFLDYFATGKLERAEAAQVVASIAKGCKDSGCALVGGETAEMPGMYGPGHYDLGGFAVGAVERSDVLPKLETITAGDVLLGLKSSGVHSNGYSLVRRVVEAEGLSWKGACPFDPSAPSLAHSLLTPTRLYVKGCLPAIRTRKVKALAHITGGGLPENLPRVLPKGIRAAIDGKSWTPPAVFQWLAKCSRSGEAEMLRTFNCGIGMVLVVGAADVAAVQEALRGAGEEPCVLGKLAAWDGKGEQVTVANTAGWGW